MTKRTQYVLYAVVLKAHPGVVKVGRTTDWKARRRQYDTWNFARWDAMKESAVYVLTEEHVDLPGLERAWIAGMAVKHPQHFGAEWFKGEIGEACRIVEHMLAAIHVSFEKTHVDYTKARG